MSAERATTPGESGSGKSMLLKTILGIQGRADRRAGADPHDPARSTPPVHARPARRERQARPAGAPGGDPRRAAQPGWPAGLLRLRAEMPAGADALLAGGP